MTVISNAIGLSTELMLNSSKKNPMMIFEFKIFFFLARRVGKQTNKGSFQLEAWAWFRQTHQNQCNYS